MTKYRVPVYGVVYIEAETPDEATMKISQWAKQLPFVAPGVFALHGVEQFMVNPRHKAVEAVEPSPRLH
jgi:hypothetical protein